MLVRRLAPWFLVLTACGSNRPSSEAGPDASTPFDGSVATIHDAAIVDAPIDARDAADGASIDHDAATTCPSNPDVPSRQTVDVVVTNDATSDRYLVTTGTWCDPFSISGPGSAPLALRLGFQCICECPNPGPAQPAGLRRLAPGESFTLTWDARSLSTCSTSVDCASMGWAGLGTAHELVGTASPVAAGSYSASITALTAVPKGCGGDGTTFSCPMNGTVGSPTPGVLPAIQTMCPGDVGASAVFALPASGDVSVALSITK